MSSYIGLVALGMSMGVVHVLTGPDHLSALATLSVNVGNCRAFWYGVKWGIGHSIGLILVGSIFIIICESKGNADGDAAIDIPENVELIFESFVGVFMLFLGLYSIIKAVKKRSYTSIDEEDIRKSMIHTSAYNDEHSVDSRSSTRSSNKGFRGVGTYDKNKQGMEYPRKSISHLSVENASPPRVRPSIINQEDDSTLQLTCGEGSLSISDVNAHIHSHNHVHDHDHLHGIVEGRTEHILSFLIGIVHGFAGPGGVLGVIPAVELHNVFLSTIYLGTFCVTSTLVMGCYAAMYGICSFRISQNTSNFEFRMELFSSALSIIVGVLWLTLIRVGKLHEIFP